MTELVSVACLALFKVPPSLPLIMLSLAARCILLLVFLNLRAADEINHHLKNVPLLLSLNLSSALWLRRRLYSCSFIYSFIVHSLTLTLWFSNHLQLSLYPLFIHAALLRSCFYLF